MAPLEIGLLAVDDVWSVGPACAERRRALVESAVAAERLGFDAWWLWAPASDELPPRAPSAPAVLVAAAAARTERLRLGAWWLELDPDLELLRIAEDVATLDGLSAGRFELEVRPFTLPFLVGPEARQKHEEDLRERVELLRRLWTETDVCWSGRARGPLEHVTLEPRPVQQPHPPLWIAAESERLAVLAGDLGLPLMLHLGATRSLAPLVERYRESAARSGSTARVGAGQLVRLRAEPPRTAVAPGALPACLGGDADAIAEAILAARDALGLDLVLAQLDAEDLEAFADEVMPALRAA